jgi:hypothetical protein
VQLAPALCTNRNRDYDPFTSSGLYDWRSCGVSSDGYQVPVDLGSYFTAPGAMAFDRFGNSVPIAQGCVLYSPNKGSNTLAAYVNGVTYVATMDGDDGDQLYFTANTPMRSATRIVVDVNAPATATSLGHTIRLFQSTGGLEVQQVDVFRGNTLLGRCLNPNPF